MIEGLCITVHWLGTTVVEGDGIMMGTEDTHGHGDDRAEVADGEATALGSELIFSCL